MNAVYSFGSETERRIFTCSLAQPFHLLIQSHGFTFLLLIGLRGGGGGIGRQLFVGYDGPDKLNEKIKPSIASNDVPTPVRKTHNNKNKNTHTVHAFMRACLASSPMQFLAKHAIFAKPHGEFSPSVPPLPPTSPSPSPPAACLAGGL